MIVTHGSVQQDILNLINGAQQVLVLACPYLDPWRGLTAAIERAHARGVAIHLILRGAEDREKQAAAANVLRPFLSSLLFIERLHAKVYLSEQAAVFSSMNLVASSALDSVEFAVTAVKQLHPDGYQQALKVCEALIAMAKQDQLRHSTGGGVGSGLRATPAVGQPHRGQPRQRSVGHCIRCGDEIARNLDKPLCPDCYKTWSKYADEDYAEERCHHCARKAATSMRKPLCRSCYEAAA